MRRIIVIISLAGLGLAGFAGTAAADDAETQMKVAHKGRSGSQWVREEARPPYALTGQAQAADQRADDRNRFEHHGRAGSEFRTR